MQEDNGFDKFVDDILIKERNQQKRDATDEELTPVQRRNKQRRENVGYLIHFGGNK